MFQAWPSTSLLSRSRVSSMTGGCSCPIFYQGVIRLCRKGKCYKFIQINWAYQKSSLGGEPRSPAATFQAWHAWQAGVLPGSCQCWQRKRDNSIQKNKRSLSEKFLRLRISRGHVSSMTRQGVGPCSPAAMFQNFNHDKGVLIRYTTREFLVLRKEV